MVGSVTWDDGVDFTIVAKLRALFGEDAEIDVVDANHVLVDGVIRTIQECELLLAEIAGREP